MEYTGSSNGLILENARRFFLERAELYVRMPVIAGVNDTVANAEETARFLNAARNLKEVKLLPYHGRGEYKARSIGVGRETFSAPSDATLSAIASVFAVPATF
jgi:pyruvate formate lyase activating enzyme